MKSLSQPNRYWHSVPFSIALITLQVVCATPIHVRVPIHIPVPIQVPAPTFDLERRWPSALAAAPR